MSHFTIVNPGPMSLLQDQGRFGFHKLGLTNGGPVDKDAYYWANKILDNHQNTTVIEITFGGVSLLSQHDGFICITGATAQISINEKNVDQWQALAIKQGDSIKVGYATEGCRIYLSVKGGFEVATQFESSATVLREGVGGIDGSALKTGQQLNVKSTDNNGYRPLALSKPFRPTYHHQLNVNVVIGYQYEYFSFAEQQRFFSSTYQVSKQVDRMGYRLTGSPINSSIDEMFSEGICLGAIQIPKDGQPIILMNDRQTIGGYPKIGSVLSIDLNKVGQLKPGDHLTFTPITIDDAHDLLALYRYKLANTPLTTLKKPNN